MSSAEVGFRLGPPDSDGDGYPDDIDAFPLDPARWVSLGGGPGETVALRRYAYDANGNVTALEASTQQASYDYDPLNRLTQDHVVDGPQSSLRYDRNGNRLEQSVDGAPHSYDYAPASNRLTAVDAEAITHDAAGNRLSDRAGQRTFTYNNAGRLYQVFEHGALIATYTYNALGQRTRKVTPTGTTLYHYDLAGQLIAETTADGTPVKDYLWVDALPVAQIEADGATETVSYLHADQLNTPRAASDAAGYVLWRWEGEAFGASLPAAESSIEVNLRFPGQYYDQETGLHYNYFRYYEPETGRYVTSDPIGLQGGLNSYLYVLAGPLGATDPFGLFFLGTPVQIPGLGNIPGGMYEALKAEAEAAFCEVKCTVECVIRFLGVKGIEELADEAAERQAAKIASEFARKGAEVAARSLFFVLNVKNTVAGLECLVTCAK